jgi:hypothetical protein
VSFNPICLSFLFFCSFVVRLDGGYAAALDGYWSGQKTGCDNTAATNLNVFIRVMVSGAAIGW